MLSTKKQTSSKKSSNGVTSAKKAKKANKVLSPQNYSQVRRMFKLGNCAEKYGLSLMDPFEGPADACMPVTPAMNSRKMRPFVRGQLSTSSTTGFGFLIANMLAFANNVSTAWKSGATYAGSTLAITGTGVTVLTSNSDMASSAFGDGLANYRLVSMGMRVRYRGSELNRGGRVVVLEEPDHAQLVGLTVDQVLAYEKAKEFEVDGKWCTLLFSGPVSPEEYDYQSSTVIATISNPYMAIIVEAASATTSVTYDYEIFWNYELIGPTVRGKTTSDADDVGASVILGSVRSLNGSSFDSSHPMVSQTGRSGTNTAKSAALLAAHVQKYAENNHSSWITSAVNFGKKALPYIEGGVRVAEAVAPLFL